MAHLDGPSAAEERKWRAQDDMRVLQQAKAIEADKDRLAAIRDVAEQQLKDAKDITGDRDDSADQMLAKGFRKLDDAS